MSRQEPTGATKRVVRSVIASKSRFQRNPMGVGIWFLGVVTVAGSVLARLGETEEAATKRYGSPFTPPPVYRDVYFEAYCFMSFPPKATEKYYIKDGIKIAVIYFPNSSGSNVVGYIKYSFQDDTACRDAYPRLLEANSAGKEWKWERRAPATGAHLDKYTAFNNVYPELTHYVERRDGAEAWRSGRTIYFRSDDFFKWLMKCESDEIEDEKNARRKALDGL